MKTKFFSFLLGLLLALPSCTSSSDEPEATTPAKPIELTAPEAASRSACASFGMDFFATELAKHEEEQNLAFSPFSAASVLAFYANAAGDELSQQIQTLLGSSDLDALNSYTKKMANRLPALDKRTDLAIANMLWYNKFYTLNPSFASVAEEIYNSPCKPVNFVDHAAVQALIDEWVKKETRGLISEFKLPFSEATLSVLANALYFKGAWAEKFDKSATADGTFHGAGKEALTPMMHATRTAGYYNDENLTLGTLDFGNGAYCMHFVLPAAGKTPLGLLQEGKLTSDILFNYSQKIVDLTIPRFEIKDGEEVNITSTLCDMGLTALQNGDDFKMFTETVSDVTARVYQKTSVIVNEEGAEAASVTIIGTDGALAPETFSLTLDRPFLFFITEKSTQTILFAGRVAQL